MSETTAKPETSIQHIDKESFWALLEEAKGYFGQDTQASAKWLRQQLQAMGPEEALRFHAFQLCYSDAADRYGLWNAAAIMMEYGCTDDGFIDFRAWLTAQGKEIYMNALKNPDSLANIAPYGNCDFESLCGVGDAAYEAHTGTSAYDAELPEPMKQELSSAQAEVQYGKGIEYPREWRDAAAYLPNLCAKHLTPQALEARFRCQLWNHDSPEIQAAFKKAAVKKKTPRRGGDAR